MTEDSRAGSQTPSLKETFGDLVELNGDGGVSQTYRILAELSLEDGRYAILQSDAMRKEGDIEVFRVTAAADGSLHLETVDNDEQWERAAEAYDDLQFGSDEQP